MFECNKQKKNRENSLFNTRLENKNMNVIYEFCLWVFNLRKIKCNFDVSETSLECVSMSSI
jgi:hypothetical protein